MAAVEVLAMAVEMAVAMGTGKVTAMEVVVTTEMVVKVVVAVEEVEGVGIGCA